MLVHLNMSLIGDCNIALFHDNLHPIMDAVSPNNDGIFQQDDAQCHRTQNWLKVYSGNFQMLREGVWSNGYGLDQEIRKLS